MASTSTWATLSQDGWLNPMSSHISFADFHCYTPDTDWLGDRDAMAKDLVYWYQQHDQAVVAAHFNKPLVAGEVGLGSDSAANYLTLSHNDRNGIWLHKLVWARTGSQSGFIPLYWYTDDIYNKKFSPIYGQWAAFMKGIPFTNGRYVSAAAGSSNGNLRALGQKDLTARQAFLWIDNATHTWWNVVNSAGSIVNQSGTITVGMGLSGARYAVTWWNPYTGLAGTTQTLQADAAGVLSLAVNNLATDTAAKIVLVSATVQGRHVFYNDSNWDLNDPEPGDSDDKAIATNKSALLPGSKAGFANITSYANGLNGIMIDVAGLSGTPTVADFVFQVGNDSNPAVWPAAPDPYRLPSARASGTEAPTGSPSLGTTTSSRTSGSGWP